MGQHVTGTSWLVASLAATMVTGTIFQTKLGSFAPQTSRDVALSTASGRGGGWPSRRWEARSR